MMRWILVGLLLLCATALAQEGQQRAEAAGQSLIGAPAPRMVLKTIDGETIDLGKLYGKKAVYLKFWATWCVPCREQMPHFEKTFESRGSDLEVIAINAGFNDSVEDVREYRKRLGIHMPIVIDDGTLGAALNLRVTPQHVVIGRDGRVQYVGHLANEQLDAALVAARGPTAGPAATRLAAAVSRRGTSSGDADGKSAVGGAGDQTQRGGTGAQPAVGGAGDQTQRGGTGAQPAVGGRGDQMQRGGTGAQPAVGGAGDQTPRGGAGGQSAVGGSGRRVGDSAPAFSAVALDGTRFGSTGPVVLVFLSPWCESYLEKSRAAVSARCRDVRTQVEELARQHPDTRWLGVASGLWASPEDLSKYVTKYNVTIPLTLDESGALFNSFHVRNVPTVIAINGHGVIEQRIEGSDSALAAELSRVASTR